MVSFTYENLVDLIRNIANSVNPTGTFVHARRSDGSLEYDGAMPQIHLYPFTLRGTDTKETDLLIAFWQQDSPASSNEEREAIIQEMDVLSRTFMETLDDYETLEILGFNGEPQYRQLAGTLSGYAVRFTIRGGIACVDTPLPVPPSCPTLCERISDATAAEIDHCLSDEQVEDLSAIICGTGTAQLNNSAGTLISNTSVSPNTTVPITAPDATAVIKNTLGTVIDSEAIPSNVSEDITIPNVAWTDSDGSVESTPYGNPIVCTPATLNVDFSANDTTPETNQTITFTDLTVGATTWLWDFGDGELSDLQNPTHAYKYAGTYTVTLHADTGMSGGFETKANYITVTLQSVYQTNLQMHNKAPVGAAPSNLTLVGANVSQWNDDTANAYHRTQGTAANRPTYTQVALTVPDGTVYGSVDYDGSNDILINTNAAFTRATGSYEVFVIKVTFPTNAGSRTIVNAGDIANSRYSAFMDHVFGGLQAAGIVLFNGGTVGKKAVAVEQNQFCVISIHWNGTSSTIRLNNNVTLSPADAIGTTTSFGSTQGNFAGGTSPFPGSFMEHIIWSSKPSDADIAEYIDKYLASKFGLW